MNIKRVWIKKTDRYGDFYNFLGDENIGVWTFRNLLNCRPQVLFNHPKVFWLATKVIKNKKMQWPHFKNGISSYEPMCYHEVPRYDGRPDREPQITKLCPPS